MFDKPEEPNKPKKEEIDDWVKEGDSPSKVVVKVLANFAIAIFNVIGAVFEAIGGVIGAIGMMFIPLIIIGGLIFLCSGTFSRIQLDKDGNISYETEEIEGWVVESSTKEIIPTEEEMEQARKEHEEEDKRYRERHDGKPSPFSFRPPRKYTVTIVQFRDGRTKRFSGVSPKPIPTGKYVKILYGGTFLPSTSIVDVKIILLPEEEENEFDDSDTEDEGTGQGSD